MTVGSIVETSGLSRTADAISDAIQDGGVFLEEGCRGSAGRHYDLEVSGRQGGLGMQAPLLHHCVVSHAVLLGPGPMARYRARR